MKYKTKEAIWLVSLLIGSMLILAACNSSSAKDRTEVINEHTEVTSVEPQVVGELPEHLPKDFPFPVDIKITTAHSESVDGKQSALLIFETSASMDDVSKMYKKYFNQLADLSETIDDKNIIIQGTDVQKQQEWSIIGGVLTGRTGIIELTVNWQEV